MTDVANLRREYDGPVFRKEHADPDPLRQFDIWMKDAIRSDDIYEPNAMSLATSTPDGRPSVRIVLLKGVDATGFVFFTNYESRKAADLTSNPHAALLFYWDRLHRQVRIEGMVERVSPEASEAYFHSRPRESQIGAWASQQSRVLENRDDLERAYGEIASRYGAADAIDLPPFWGGYRVVPVEFEFWQGQESRLHDRLRYTLQPDQSWKIERLAP